MKERLSELRNFWHRTHMTIEMEMNGGREREDDEKCNDGTTRDAERDERENMMREKPFLREGKIF